MNEMKTLDIISLENKVKYVIKGIKKIVQDFRLYGGT